MAKQWMKYGVGIDVSKDQLHACLSGMQADQRITVIAQRKFNNTLVGFEQLGQWIGKHRKQAAVELQAVLEVTGVYHEGVLYFLYEQGIDVSLQLAKRTKRYVQSLGYDSKTDRLDGQGLSHMACERRLELWRPICAKIGEIRTLLRHRKALLVARMQFNNQLHALEYAQLKPQTVMRSLQEMIARLDAQIEQIGTQALELARQDDALWANVERIVDSLKGVGALSIVGIIAETNGFESFSNAKQVVRYAGLDIIENSSGQHQGKTRISKQGNARIRNLLFMPSLSLVRYKVDPFYSIYLRLIRRNGGIKMKALVSIQRKLLILLFRLWKTQQAFDPDYSAKVLQKGKPKRGVAPETSEATGDRTALNSPSHAA